MDQILLEDANQTGGEFSEQQAERANFTGFEQQLSDIADLLRRCAAYRRDFYMTTAAATKQASDYALFLQTLPIYQKIEEAQYITDARGVEAIGYQNSANAFRTGSGAPNSGWAIYLDTASKSAEATHNGLQSAKDLIFKKWSVLREYQDRLQARHTSPGHPLNYTERATRSLKLIRPDFREAYLKALRADLAVKNVYSACDVMLPDRKVSAQSLFEDLALWHRDMSQFIGRMQEQERDLEIILSATSRWPGEMQTDFDERRNSFEDFKSGENNLDIDDSPAIQYRITNTYNFISIKNSLSVRLIGVGLSAFYAYQDPKPGPDGLGIFSLVIRPPNKISYAGDLCCNVVAASSGSSISARRLSWARVANHSPEGIWQIRCNLDPLISGVSAASARGKKDLADVRLHLFMKIL